MAVTGTIIKSLGPASNSVKVGSIEKSVTDASVKKQTVVATTVHFLYFPPVAHTTHEGLLDVITPIGRTLDYRDTFFTPDISHPIPPSQLQFPPQKRDVVHGGEGNMKETILITVGDDVGYRNFSRYPTLHQIAHPLKTGLAGVMLGGANGGNGVERNGWLPPRKAPFGYTPIRRSLE